MNIQSKVIGYYQTQDGACPFQEWVKRLKDRQTQMRIDARLVRLRSGIRAMSRPLGRESWSCGLITDQAIVFTLLWQE